MKTGLYFVIGCFLIAFLLLACNGGKTDSISFPDFSGKADTSQEVIDKGRIFFTTDKWETWAAGIFEMDNQFFSHFFIVADEAEVTLEVTREGSSSTLATSLAVYGPLTGESFGKEPIVTDTDSGWGKLSKISGLQLRGGVYLAVINNLDGTGRSGNYRLKLFCDLDRCEKQVDPELLYQCAAELQQPMVACVEENAAENDNSVKGHE